MTEAPSVPARPSWPRRIARFVFRAFLALVLAIVLVLAGLTLYGRGNLGAGATSAMKEVFLRALGFDGPIFTFWGKPVIWVEASGTHGYTGIGMDLEVLDLRTPGELTSLGEVEIGGMVHGLALTDDVLYASAGDAGLVVIDVEDPAKARRIVKLPSFGYTFGIFLDEERDRVYVTERDAGVRVFDVSKRRRPKLLGTFPDTEWSNDVVVRGTTAFVADGKLGLLVVDFADPAAPELIATMAIPGEEPLLRPIDPAPLAMELHGDILYLACVERDLVVVDVSDPARPRAAATLALPGETMDVRRSGDRLYLAQEPVGLGVVDITDPLAPSVITVLPVAGSTHSVSTAGPDHVLVGLLAQGAALVDVSDPAKPVVVKRSRVEPEARTVALTADESHALVADGPGGLGIYSLADPTRPQEVARVPGTDYVYDVRVVGSRAYVAGGQQGLVVLDIADPAAPAVLDAIKTPEHAFSVTLADGRAYTAEGMYQFVGVRLDEPEGLRADTVGAHQGYGMSVLALGDEQLLVGNFMGGLKLIDVSTQDLGSHRFRQDAVGDGGPFAPPGGEPGVSWVGPPRVMDMDLENGLVYLALFDGGLTVLDVSAVPVGVPAIRSDLALGEYHFGIDVRGELAAVAGHERGLYLVDVSDPDAPREMARIPTRDRSFGVALGERHAYLADGSAGLRVIDISEPGAPRPLP